MQISGFIPCLRSELSSAKLIYRIIIRVDREYILTRKFRRIHHITVNNLSDNIKPHNDYYQ